MGFLNIHSNYLLSNYSGVEHFYLPLKIIRDDGVEVNPNSSVSILELNSDSSKNVKNRHFVFSGDAGITAKVKVLIGRNDRWKVNKVYNGTTNKWEGYNNPKVTSLLNKFFIKGTVIRVVTDAIDIPNGEYIITKNPSRKQHFKDSTVWELELTTYRRLAVHKWKNNNSVVKKAIKKSKKIASKSKSSKSSSSYKSKLKKCKISQMKYSKTKKFVTCVKYLQKVLKKLKLYSGVIDGWYGQLTVSAVKKFQKKYKRKYKLTDNGKMNSKTLNALVKV